MTSEDPETYDIHGDLMGGWPSVVKPVIASTHSLNYDPEKIDPKVHKSVRFRLSQLVKQAELHSTRPESHKLAVRLHPQYRRHPSEIRQLLWP